MLTQAELKSRLHYDPETGIFTWISSVRRNDLVGEPAGYAGTRGYISITIGNKIYKAHRLAFLYEYGTWPDQVDHINGNTSDNRAINLRDCSRCQNMSNRKINKNSKSGVKGVYWNGKYNKWTACISANKKRIFLGYFSILEEAEAAIRAKREELHGEFCRYE